MNIITPPPQTPITQAIPDSAIIHTPRHRMIAIILKALLRKDPVTLGKEQLRFCQRGQTFEDGDYAFEALSTGLYQRFGVWENTTPLDGPPHHYTWCHVGDLGWFDSIIAPILDRLSACERECAIVAITFTNVMREMRAHHPTSATTTSRAQ